MPSAVAPRPVRAFLSRDPSLSESHPDSPIGGGQAGSSRRTDDAPACRVRELWGRTIRISPTAGTEILSGPLLWAICAQGRAVAPSAGVTLTRRATRAASLALKAVWTGPDSVFSLSVCSSLMEYRLNSPDVVQEDLEGEVIVVHLVSGSYYSLTKSGADVWKRLVAGQTAGAIVDQLAEITDGTPAVIGPAVDQFVADLVAEQLLVSAAAGSAGLPMAAVATPAERIPFEAPRFEKFTDMQELLLVDPIHEVAEAGWPLQPGTPESGAVPQGQLP